MGRNPSDLATLPGFYENQVEKGVEYLEDENFEDELPDYENLKDNVLNDLDTGALVNQMTAMKMVPKPVDLTSHERKIAANNPETLIWTFAEKPMSETAPKGSYRGTQLAMTKVYDLIEKKYLYNTFHPFSANANVLVDTLLGQMSPVSNLRFHLQWTG